MATLIYSGNVPMWSGDRGRDLKPETLNPIPIILIGDTVQYRFSVGEFISESKGKVIGLFNTRDGQTIADVEWDKLGPPTRLNVRSLVKAQPTDSGG